MNYAIVWIANGFNPNAAFTTDEFSKNCLALAAWQYRQLKNDGEKTAFLVINSVVRDPRAGILLRDTMLSDVRNAGIPEEDIVLLPTETTGSTTDGLSLARYAKEHPDTRIKIFGTVPMATLYLQVMHRAVARHVVGITPSYEFYSATVGESWRSYFLYFAMRIVTRIAALTRPTFTLWYNFLNWAYKGRKEGFTRTVS